MIGNEYFFWQVFLTTLDLLDAALVSIGGCKEARHNHVVAALEPTVATLLKKQGDGQARLRDGAMNGLVAVARCRTAGPIFVRCVQSFRLTTMAVVLMRLWAGIDAPSKVCTTAKCFGRRAIQLQVICLPAFRNQL